MDRREAINELRYMLPKEITSSISRKKHEAVNMAIEALSEPKIIHCKGCKFRMKYYGKYCCWLDAEDKIVEDYDFCSRAERKEDGEK